MYSELLKYCAKFEFLKHQHCHFNWKFTVLNVNESPLAHSDEIMDVFFTRWLDCFLS